jgi:CheY-like chemotaxis protein
MNPTLSPPLFSVLIVDDDPVFRKGLAASLKTGGYSVELARNAEEALHYVREWPVDIILLDINMPEIGGLEACQRIRAVAPRSGILMLTVRDTEDDKVQALAAGADDLHYQAVPAARTDCPHGSRAAANQRRRRDALIHNARGPDRVKAGRPDTEERRPGNPPHSQRV